MDNDWQGNKDEKNSKQLFKNIRYDVWTYFHFAEKIAFENWGKTDKGKGRGHGYDKGGYFRLLEQVYSNKIGREKDK